MSRLHGYWATTAVLAFVLLSGGIADVIRAPATAQGVLDLGYPPIFLTILGTWKILGAAALLAPGRPRLKEWAYAGAFFNFSGAVVTHLSAGSEYFHVLVTGSLALLTLASWYLRPASRTLSDRDGLGSARSARSEPSEAVAQSR